MLSNKKPSYHYQVALSIITILMVEYDSRNNCSHTTSDCNWLRTLCAVFLRHRQWNRHSRSLAMAQFNRPCHFLFVVCSDHLSILYRFWDIERRIMKSGLGTLGNCGLYIAKICGLGTICFRLVASVHLRSLLHGEPRKSYGKVVRYGRPRSFKVVEICISQKPYATFYHSSIGSMCLSAIISDL